MDGEESNVVSLSDARASKQQADAAPAAPAAPTGDAGLAEAAEKNRKNRERMERERLAANKSVLRSYRIKN